VGLPRPAGFEVETDLNLGERFGRVSGILSDVRPDGFAPNLARRQPPEAVRSKSPVQGDPSARGGRRAGAGSWSAIAARNVAIAVFIAVGCSYHG
jgi:hypothetical protein